MSCSEAFVYLGQNVDIDLNFTLLAGDRDGEPNSGNERSVPRCNLGRPATQGALYPCRGVASLTQDGV